MSDGEMGRAPEWFVLLKVARYLNVPPWDLAKQPVGWLRMATLAVSFESRRAARD